MTDRVRIGVDLGGTKIEALALDGDDRELLRRRVATPRDDYDATIEAIRALVVDLESRLGVAASIGVGMPGSISRTTGLVRNANSTWLNGRRFDADLATALARPVRVANDANCFALSEAGDGAGAGSRVVFGVILGTGVGGGLVIDGALRVGRNGVAGGGATRACRASHPRTCRCLAAGAAATAASRPSCRVRRCSPTIADAATTPLRRARSSTTRGAGTPPRSTRCTATGGASRSPSRW